MLLIRIDRNSHGSLGSSVPITPDNNIKCEALEMSPHGDKDGTLKLLSAAQHTTAKRALLICRDHCAAAAAAAASFGNISGTAAYSAGTKRMSLHL